MSSTQKLDKTIASAATPEARRSLASHGLRQGGAVAVGRIPRPPSRRSSLTGMERDLAVIDKDFAIAMTDALEETIPAGLIAAVVAWPTSTGASKAALEVTVDLAAQAIMIEQPAQYLSSTPSLRSAWARIEQAATKATAKAAKEIEGI